MMRHLGLKEASSFITLGNNGQDIEISFRKRLKDTGIWAEGCYDLDLNLKRLMGIR